MRSNSLNILLFLLLTLFLPGKSLQACRMLAFLPPGDGILLADANDSLSSELTLCIDALQQQGGAGPWPNSNRNGWAITLQQKKDGQSRWNTHRSATMAYADSNYQQVHREFFTGQRTSVYLGHVRAASTGNPLVPDPHPFIGQDERNRIFAFAHNGHLDKTELREIIGETWLQDHQPQTFGTGDWRGSGWAAVVDSELFFIWLLKNLSAHQDILVGLSAALDTLERRFSKIYPKNFILSDGETLYAYRSSNAADIHYLNPGKDGSGSSIGSNVIMSTPPADWPDPDQWQELPDQVLLILRRGEPRQLIAHFDQYHMAPHFLTAQPSSSILSPPYPNPANFGCWFPLQLANPGQVDLSIYDVTGKQCARIQVTFNTAGDHRLQWNATDHQRSAAPAGLYLYVLEFDDRREAGRLTLLR